jgi:hypothetical protein
VAKYLEEMVAGGAPSEEMVGNYGEMEEQNQKLEALEEPQDPSINGQLKRLFWHGGSVYDAWFSAASNQVMKRPFHTNLSLSLSLSLFIFERIHALGPFPINSLL